MRLFPALSSSDELRGRGLKCAGRAITDEIHHSCRRPGADQSAAAAAAGRFQRAAVISLHPQLSCEMLMKQTVFPSFTGYTTITLI